MSTGVVNFKTRFNERSHNPPCKTTSTWSIGPSTAPFVQDPIIGMGAPKRRFDEPRGVEEEFKPANRPVYHKEYTEQNAVRGKRTLTAPVPKEHVYTKTRLPDIPSIEYTVDESLARKTKVVSLNGESVGRKESKEFQLELYVNRKQRITDTLQQRNGIGIATPGDKAFKQADREPGFYAKGGLIVGSTNKINKSAKPSLRKSNDGMTTKKLGPSYAEKQLLREREYETNQVNFLTNPTSKQGENVPSWEEKTGMFLIDPDYEAY